MVRRVLQAAVCMAFVCGVVSVNAQTNYFKVPVTYYDFHDDFSNPEFGIVAFRHYFSPPHGTGPHGWTPDIIKGCVATTLDSDKKPVKSATTTEVTVANINQWYRSWTTGHPVTFSRPGDTLIRKIDSVCTPLIWDGETLEVVCEYTYDSTIVAAGTVTSDTAFKNVTIHDSLKFSETSPSGFFLSEAANASWEGVLDNRGFGNEGKSHNGCFSMELHNQITYRVGQTMTVGFNGGGWVFINGALVLDGGGMHGMGSTESKSLDNLGLVAGQQYAIDFFFAGQAGPGTFHFYSNLEFVNKQGGITFVAPGRWAMSHGLPISANRTMLLPAGTSHITVSVYNALGTLVNKVQKSDQNSPTFDLDPLLPRATGVYWVQAHCLDNAGRALSSFTNKIVVTR